MIYTTLKKIEVCRLHEKGWVKLLANLGKIEADDEPMGFDVILASNGLEDTLWCCQTVPEYDKIWRLYAVWCARQVQYLMKDQSSITALDVAERHAQGHATDAELDVAWDAAWDVAAKNAAREAWVVMSAAAWEAAVAVAEAAAAEAAIATAEAAAWAAAWAASDAAGAAAWAAARKDQEAQFLRMLNEVE